MRKPKLKKLLDQEDPLDRKILKMVEERKMIFIAKNEKGEPTWKLAKEGKKTVTRRLKPLPVGKEFAIQPGRGKFAVCRARVTTLCLSVDHFNKFGYDTGSLLDYKESEAKKEGFES